MSNSSKDITVGSFDDLQLLSSFLNDTFKTDSFIYKHATQLVDTLSTEIEQLRGLNRVAASSIRPSNAFELLVVALHCSILDIGFKCVAQHDHKSSGVHHNAIPVGSLLPPNWNKSHPSVIAIAYEHDQHPHSTYKLEASTDGKQALVQFSLQDEDSQHSADAITSLTLQDYVDSFAAAEPIISGGCASGASIRIRQYTEDLMRCFTDYEVRWCDFECV